MKKETKEKLKKRVMDVLIANQGAQIKPILVSDPRANRHYNMLDSNKGILMTAIRQEVVDELYDENKIDRYDPAPGKAYYSLSLNQEGKIMKKNPEFELSLLGSPKKYWWYCIAYKMLSHKRDITFESDCSDLHPLHVMRILNEKVVTKFALPYLVLVNWKEISEEEYTTYVNVSFITGSEGQKEDAAERMVRLIVERNYGKENEITIPIR